MGENLSKGDSAGTDVRAVVKAIAKAQGGTNNDDRGLGDKEIGGLYAAGLADDHRQPDTGEDSDRPRRPLYD
jgi:hypothetical protein